MNSFLKDIKIVLKYIEKYSTILTKESKLKSERIRLANLKSMAMLVLEMLWRNRSS